MDATASMTTRASGQTSVVLDVGHLTVGYRGKPVVRDASLVVNAGEVIGLVGHNGSGKSTLLHGISGLVWGHVERLMFLGEDIEMMPAYRRAQIGLGMLLQRDGIFPEMSIGENLSFAGIVANEFPPFAQWAELAARFRSIQERQRERAGRLSGGERRLLSLAMIIARQPSALLADEPTLGLSVQLEELVLRCLRAYAAIPGRAVLGVLHNIPLAEATCDRVYVIGHGEIRYEFRPGVSSGTLGDYIRQFS
jgi:ABC-type branched-subunit amino acid transport system ATPase component